MIAGARVGERGMAERPFRKIDERVYVAPQLVPADFAAAKAAGIRTVVNNRPDGEAPDQLSSAEAERLASEAGLAYVHIPVPLGGGPTGEMAEAFGRTLAETEGPLLAYCRSGTRSCTLWAVASAGQGEPVDQVLAIAGRAGYDLGGARPLLERAAAAAAGAARQPETSHR
jgi:uncharacterized protein (TIGR01244 family)